MPEQPTVERVQRLRAHCEKYPESYSGILVPLCNSWLAMHAELAERSTVPRSRYDAVDRQLVAAEAKLQEVTANAKRAVEAQEKELAPLRRDYAECVGDHQHKNALLAKAEDESEALKAEIAALREQGSAHDAEVAAKARAEALEVECTRVCTNCSRRVAVRWCSKWKFFYHGEPRYACSASAIRELFAARWPDQFGPKEPTVQPKEVRDGA